MEVSCTMWSLGLTLPSKWNSMSELEKDAFMWNRKSTPPCPTRAAASEQISLSERDPLGLNHKVLQLGPGWYYRIQKDLKLLKKMLFFFLFFFWKPQVNPNCGLTCIQTATGYLDWISGLDRNIRNKNKSHTEGQACSVHWKQVQWDEGCWPWHGEIPFFKFALANRFAINPPARDAVYK